MECPSIVSIMPLSILCIIITLFVFSNDARAPKRFQYFTKRKRRREDCVARCGILFLSVSSGPSFHKIKNYYLSLWLIAILWKFIFFFFFTSYFKNCRSPNVELFDDNHRHITISPSLLCLFLSLSVCFSPLVSNGFWSSFHDRH